MATQYLTRKNTQWWRYDDVENVTVETLNVMSAEYRDLFSQTGASWAVWKDITNTTTSFPAYIETFKVEKSVSGQAGVTLIPGEFEAKPLGTQSTQVGGNTLSNAGVSLAAATVTHALSDEVAHEDLRQTQLTVTHWKIDRGASFTPRYIYATWADGDAWSDYPPGYLTTDNQ